MRKRSTACCNNKNNSIIPLLKCIVSALGASTISPVLQEPPASILFGSMLTVMHILYPSLTRYGLVTPCGVMDLSQPCIGLLPEHYCDVILVATASQITSLTSVCSTFYSDAVQRKHQIYASLAFVRGIHRGPVNSPHKWPVTRKMFPFDDVIMGTSRLPEGTLTYHQ